VRVRATDAIVIDFFSHKKAAPVLCDAAALEASLLIEGFSGDRRQIEEIRESIRSLYDGDPFDILAFRADPRNSSFWFHVCVQQIRRYARQWQCGPNQYAATLALAFLTKAKKDPQVEEPEASRRALAYVFAEQLLVNAFTKSGAPKAA
jgi:hypothetical protein